MDCLRVHPHGKLIYKRGVFMETESTVNGKTEENKADVTISKPDKLNKEG